MANFLSPRKTRSGAYDRVLFRKYSVKKVSDIWLSSVEVAGSIQVWEIELSGVSRSRHSDSLSGILHRWKAQTSFFTSGVKGKRRAEFRAGARMEMLKPLNRYLGFSEWKIYTGCSAQRSKIKEQNRNEFFIRNWSEDYHSKLKWLIFQKWSEFMAQKIRKWSKLMRFLLHKNS